MTKKSGVGSRGAGVEKAARAAFDAAYYLETYPDVAVAGLDPYAHYMSVGWREGRDPSGRFDTAYYLRTNPDVREAGLNPLVHYLTSGRREGREPLPPHLRRRPLSLSRIAGASRWRARATVLDPIVVVVRPTGRPGLRDFLAMVGATAPPGSQVLISSSGAPAVAGPGHLVFLDSGVRPPPDWAERLLAPILAAPEVVATATPFSNRAAFTALDPELLDLDAADASRDLDQALARMPETAPEIPGGDAFCIAVNGAALEAVGGFDPDVATGGAWFRRAFLAGYAHVAANLYVDRDPEPPARAGGGGRRAGRGRARRVPAGRSPGGDALPRHGAGLAGARRLGAVDGRPRPRRRQQCLLRPAGGQAAIEAGAFVVRLGLAGGRVRVAVRWGERRLEAEEAFAPELLNLAELLDVDEVLLAGAHGADDVEGLLAAVGACAQGRRLTVTVCDFLPVCPTVHLMSAEDRFCGVPGPDACEACFFANPNVRFVTAGVAPWRRAWSWLLGQAHEVRAFSESSLDLMWRAFPELDPARLTLADTGYAAASDRPAGRPSRGGCASGCWATSAPSTRARA